MTKLCSNCGKKIGIFNDPLELDDIVLCYECAKAIRDDLNGLYCLESKKEFFELRDKIIQKSKTLYSENIVSCVDKEIISIYDNIKTELQNDVSGEIPEIELQYPGGTQAVSDGLTNQEHFSLDDLYADIGKKIKKWAKWIFIIEAIGAIIAGLILIFQEEYLVLCGFLTLIFGPGAAFVGSWLLYAFGELVDKTVENEKNTRNILNIMREQNSQHKE